MLVLACSITAEAAPRVLVFKSYHDNLVSLLDAYRIPYIMKRASAVAQETSLSGFDAVFIPCGVEQPIEAGIHILAQGKRIHGVSLKDDYMGIDYSRVNALLQEFVKNGGMLYAAGYSYTFIEALECSLSFYNDFPHFGTTGRMQLFLKDDFASFVMRNDLQLPVLYNGWVALQKADAAVLAKGYFPTVQGEREGPVAFLHRYGKGVAHYSSYHTDSDILYMRYFILRTAYGAMMNEALDKARYWGQSIVLEVTDVFKADEYARSYRCLLPPGTITLYINSPFPVQIDIFAGKKLVGSWDIGFAKEVQFKNTASREVRIHMYQGTRTAYKPFSIVVAEGRRIVPYMPVVAVGTGILFGMLAVGFTWRRIHPRRFSGKRRYWFRDGHILHRGTSKK